MVRGVPAGPVAAGVSREWLTGDAIAGVTLAAYAIPVSLAYASLAGLPPQHGIFCYLLGGLVYALFGTSRQLAIGPTRQSPCSSARQWPEWQRATPPAGSPSPR